MHSLVPICMDLHQATFSYVQCQGKSFFSAFPMLTIPFIARQPACACSMDSICAAEVQQSQAWLRRPGEPCFRNLSRAR